MSTPTDPVQTSVQDHANHPEAGSGLRDQRKSFDPDVGAESAVQLKGSKGDDGADPTTAEIAADDAGVSAMAEVAQKRADAGEIEVISSDELPPKPASQPGISPDSAGVKP